MFRSFYLNSKKVHNFVHANIKRHRTRLGLTQETVAARLQVMGLDIASVAISRMEHNRRHVSDYELYYLCKALGVTPNELLTDLGPEG